MLAVIIALAAIFADVERLTADDFDTREAAQERLKTRGAVVWPILCEILDTQDDPELRYRTRKAGGLKFCLEYDGNKVKRLMQGFEPTRPEIYWDDETCREMWQHVLASGVDIEYRSGHPREWAPDAIWRLDPNRYNVTRQGDPALPPLCVRRQNALRVFLNSRNAPMPRVKQ